MFYSLLLHQHHLHLLCRFVYFHTFYINGGALLLTHLCLIWIRATIYSLWHGLHCSIFSLVQHYLLGTRESYGLTAQHTEDSPIFFIQLNYVYNKRNKVLPPYVNSLCHKVADAGNSTSSFSISAILHSCMFDYSWLFIC